jgi:arylformamidase
MAVWPGDTAYESFWKVRLDEGDSCNVGSITMSLHTGTHADAPYHFLHDGASTTDLDLSCYLGPALVVDTVGVGVISTDTVEKLEDNKIERVLFRTLSSTPDRFNSDFTYLTPEAAEALVNLGIKLIGIDTPSVDQANSKSLETHKIFAANSVGILENLALQEVSPGWYELIALPLKLAGMDASPVRAILRCNETQKNI